MWCTAVAGGAFLIFRIVVSGDIGDHWSYANEKCRLPDCGDGVEPRRFALPARLGGSAIRRITHRQ
jgi:hypothetical protein